MTAPVLVTGGTGTLGTLVVERLLAAGLPLRVLSRRPQPPAPDIDHVTGDLEMGAGIHAAVGGVTTIVHLAGSAKRDDVKARTLLDAAREAGTVRHVVHISVVGADRVPMASAVDRAMFGYFADQAEAEQLVIDSGLPWTVLRATQFHQLLFKVAHSMRKLPVLFAPRDFRFQPIDAAEVADRLVQLTLAGPAGRVSDMGGPQVRGLADILSAYLESTGRRRPILTVGMPGAAARAFRDGANLAPEHTVGSRTWEAFLARRDDDYGEF